MIYVFYETGNGERCSCHRQTWMNWEEFETKQNAIEWLTEQELGARINRDDYEFLFCIEGTEIDASFDKKRVESQIEAIKQKKKEEKEKKQKEQAEKRRLRDMETLEALKAKYE